METQDDVKYAALYTPADISRYAHVHAGTLRLWSGGRSKGLLKRADGCGIAPFSFINLIEAHVLIALRRQHQVPMHRIRKAVEWLGKKYGMQHPLAELDLRTDGYSVFVEHLGQTLSASARGQIAIPEVVDVYLQRVERDAAGPVRFYPFTTYEGCPKAIVMDPRVDFGRPVIAGTRIETVMIFDRYSGGESLSSIAADYDLGLSQIEEAVRCEMARRAA